MQQAGINNLLNEVEIIRRLPTSLEGSQQVLECRRASIPLTHLSYFKSGSNNATEEEEQAIAGRLEIRVVDATGGTTIVRTSVDEEPLQGMIYSMLKLVYLSVECNKFTYFFDYSTHEALFGV